MRVLVSFAVIMAHAAADVITEYGKVPGDWWWAANFYDSLVRGCVPVFIMISGALLLPGTEPIAEFFKKRFNRVAIPFVVWTVLYLLWKKYLYEPDMTLGEAVRAALSSHVHFHLWFMYSLTALYLITPVFRVFARHASKNEILYFVALWFVVGSWLPFMERLNTLLRQAPIHLQIAPEAATGLIGFFVLGYYIRKYGKQSWTLPALGCWLGAFLVRIIGTERMTHQFHHYQNLFFENLSPAAVVYATAFFILAQNANPWLQTQLPAQIHRGIKRLSTASFGIYLLHPMILEGLIKGRFGLVLRPSADHPLIMIPLVTGIVYFLSFILVSGLQKVPGVRKIV